MSGDGSEREGDPDSEAGTRCRAVGTEPGAGLELTNREIMIRAEVGHSTDLATPVPLYHVNREEIRNRVRAQIPCGGCPGILDPVLLFLSSVTLG